MAWLYHGDKFSNNPIENYCMGEGGKYCLKDSEFIHDSKLLNLLVFFRCLLHNP